MPIYAKEIFESLRKQVERTNPSRFKFKIGDDVSVIRNPQGVANPVVCKGMRGVVRDYSPIIDVYDEKTGKEVEAKSYHVEFQNGTFIAHEECLALTSELDPDHFKIK